MRRLLIKIFLPFLIGDRYEIRWFVINGQSLYYLYARENHSKTLRFPTKVNLPPLPKGHPLTTEITSPKL